jgi:hypothetical protein
MALAPFPSNQHGTQPTLDAACRQDVLEHGVGHCLHEGQPPQHGARPRRLPHRACRGGGGRQASQVYGAGKGGMGCSESSTRHLQGMLMATLACTQAGRQAGSGSRLSPLTRDLQVPHALVQWRQHVVLLAGVNHACRRADRQTRARAIEGEATHFKRAEQKCKSKALCRNATRGRNATPSPDSYSSCTKVSCWRNTAMAALHAGGRVGSACETGQVSRDINKHVCRWQAAPPPAAARWLSHKLTDWLTGRTGWPGSGLGPRSHDQ